MPFGKTLLLVFLLLCSVQCSHAQQCDAPAILSSKFPVAIGPEQESLLGDIMAGTVLTSVRTIELEELNAPLQKIVDRLYSVTPPNSPKIHVRIVESPATNAMALVGGQIFVTRRALVLARNEDEVAGLLAHEMGHVVTGQLARDYETLLRAVLERDALGGKEQVEERFHEFTDKIALRPQAAYNAFMKVRNRMEKEQIEADEVSLYLLSRAGYKPQAFIDYFDRLTGNNGKIGSAWSDFFRTTRPESKRLREMVTARSAMPVNCVQRSGRMTEGEFERWHLALQVYSGFGKKEAVPGGRKHELKDPLRSKITHLRFSPDGKYILAQDPSSIYLLSRDPLRTLFRIDAENAYKAQFTPDSENFVFVTDSSRVERWNIAQQAQVDAVEMHIPHPCLQQAVSPRGQYLACLQLNDKGGLPRQVAVLDVATGEPVWIQKDVVKQRVSYFDPGGIESYYRIIWMDFSPDGHYLVGAGDNGPFAYDFDTRQALQLNPEMKRMLEGFTFLSSDKVLSYGSKDRKAAVVSFPSGAIIASDVPVGQASASSTSNPGVFKMKPYLHAAAALIDIATQKVLLKTNTSSVDIFESLFVMEKADGELGLYDMQKNAMVASNGAEQRSRNKFRHGILRARRKLRCLQRYVARWRVAARRWKPGGALRRFSWLVHRLEPPTLYAVPACR